MKKIKATLSSTSLNELAEKIKQLKNDLQNVDKEVMNELAEKGRDEIDNNLSATTYKDGNDEAIPFIRKEENKMVVGMKGKQVLYDEFGTGTEGAKSPHPLKSEFGLKNYNSSRVPNGTIRRNKNPNSKASISGIKPYEWYWTYNDKSGNKVYTQGIPAGKQVFNASLSLKQIKMLVVKKKVSDALSKL